MAWLAACGTPYDLFPDAGMCPADEPTSCPTPMPSYTKDIAPFVVRYCAAGACHGPNGTASDQPLSTWSDLESRALNVKTQVYQCRMPEPPIDQPSLPERVTFLGWFVCGAPNN